MQPRPVRTGASLGRCSRLCADLSLVMRASMNGYAPARVNRIPGKTTVGQKIGGKSYPHNRISHDGNRRVDPSRNIMYQSGCDPDETARGSYGPNNHTGLIWAKPPRAAQAANTMKKKPPALAAYVGKIRSPETVCSVRPGAGNSECFCRTSKARWAAISASRIPGIKRTCVM